MNATEIRKYFINSVKFVGAIAEDIKRNECSEEVIAHAKEYAHVENEYGDFWRVDWCGAYAYVDIDKDGLPTGRIWWNNEDYDCDRLDGKDTIAKLESMSDEEILNTVESSYLQSDNTDDNYFPLKYESL